MLQFFVRQRVARQMCSKARQVGIRRKNLVADETDELSILIGKIVDNQGVGQFLNCVDIGRSADRKFDSRTIFFEHDFVFFEQNEMPDTSIDNSEELKNIVEHVYYLTVGLFIVGQNLDHE